MGKDKKSRSAKVDAAAGQEVPATTGAKPSETAGEAVTSDHEARAASPTEPDDKDDFESLYLKQITAEFADDLDKLRNASDFSEKSVPILVSALKATAGVYTEEEKAKAMARK